MSDHTQPPDPSHQLAVLTAALASVCELLGDGDTYDCPQLLGKATCEQMGCKLDWNERCAADRDERFCTDCWHLYLMQSGERKVRKAEIEGEGGCDP